MISFDIRFKFLFECFDITNEQIFVYDDKTKNWIKANRAFKATIYHFVFTYTLPSIGPKMKLIRLFSSPNSFSVSLSRRGFGK